MNKLLVVEDNKKISSGDYLLEYETNTKINIDGNVRLINYASNNKDLDIELNDNSKLVFDKVSILSSDLNINFNIKNNVCLEYNMVIINEGNNKVNIVVNMTDNNSKALIRLRVINKNSASNINIECLGKVKEGTINNELLEDLKGLVVSDSTIKISPIMEVDTNEVIANHLVTIGTFAKEDLFYLTSKKMSSNKAKYLLMEAFATSITALELKEKIKMEVINIE